MNPEDRKKFVQMETVMEKMQSDVSQIKSALLGNHLSGEKGLVGRIDVLSAKQEILEKEIKSLREERVKNTVYVSIIRVLGTLLLASAIAFFFSIIKK